MNKLKVVDFLLMFTGKIQRQQLMDISGISIATASRTLTTYREHYPNNIYYDIGQKSYVIADSFEPAFKHDVESSLRTLAYGQRIETTHLESIGPKVSILAKPSPEIKVVATICQAIFRKKSIKLTYSSTNTGTRERNLSPHSIFESKKQWYFRALDSGDEKFKTFSFARTGVVIFCEQASSKVDIAKDSEWYREVILTLGPHLKHPYPEALKLDLGLTDKPVVNIKTSAALAGFLLAEWGVDSSEDASLDPYFFQYSLLNLHELETVSSMRIAPGFSTRDSLK